MLYAPLEETVCPWCVELSPKKTASSSGINSHPGTILIVYFRMEPTAPLLCSF